MTERVTSPPVASGDLRAIAYHEAGHVVVGTLLGLEVLGTDLDRDDVGGRGHTHFAPPPRWFQPQLGSVTSAERDLIERVVTTFMAGFAAEVKLGSADVEGSGWDLDLAAREWLSRLDRDRRKQHAGARRHFKKARAILDEPDAWAAVERVAAELLLRQRLDGVEARAQVPLRRSTS